MHTSLCMPPLSTTIKFCYPRRSLEFQECLLVTITSVLDGSWMLSGDSIITQDCTVVGKCVSYSSKTLMTLGNQHVKWICCVWSLHMQAGQGETCSDVKAVLSSSKENVWTELTALE